MTPRLQGRGAGVPAVAALAVVSIAVLSFCARPASHEQVASRTEELTEAGELTEALLLARDHASYVERFEGGESLAVAAALDLLVEVLAQGDDEQMGEGLRAASRSLAIKQALLSPGSPEIATSHEHIGAILGKRHEEAVARGHLLRALEIRRLQGDGRGVEVADTLSHLADLDIHAGDYAAAIVGYEEVIAILEDNVSDDDPGLAFARSMYANLLAQTGDGEKAVVLHGQALAARIRHYGRVHCKVAGSLNNLAAVHLALGNLELAREHMQEALEIRERRLGPGHSLTAATRFNVSVVLDALGERAEADALLEKSLGELVAAVGEQHPYVASHLTAQAMRQARNGATQPAIERYTRALRIQQQIYGGDHPEVAETLVPLAVQFAESGRLRDALDTTLRAEEIASRLQKLTCEVMSERHALKYSKLRDSGLDLAIALAVVDDDAETTVRAWTALIRSRALVLDEMATRRRLSTQSKSPEIAAAWEALRAARENLAAVAVRGPDPETPQAYSAEIERAQQEREKAERELARRSVVFRRSLLEERITLDEIARAIPPRAALLAFVRYADPRGSEAPSSYAAFLLPAPGAQPVAFALGDAAEIDALVEGYRQQITRPGEPAAMHEVGDALRRRIWDAVERRLPTDAGLVLVVPDGALNLVNLAALPLDEARFLIERPLALHLLSTERDAMTSPEHGLGDGLLAVANPHFGGAPLPENETAGGRNWRSTVEDCGAPGRSRLAALPGSEREVDGIVRAWNVSSDRRPSTLIGRAASEAAFKTEAPGMRILHLATHGYFLDSACVAQRRGTRGLGGVERIPSAAAVRHAEDNPLLLSGVMLSTPNPGAAEDGVLTAEEIAGMNLAGTEWAVLSACQTGMGRVQSREGVLGLRRAFRVAGVETVIMSLWSVEDASTSDWMQRLYEGRLAGLTSADAVNRATLESLRARRLHGESTHPFYWAGFVASGNWN